MQERELKAPKQDFAGEKKKIVYVQTDENIKTQINKNVKTFSNIPTIRKQMKAVYLLYCPYFHRLRMSIQWMSNNR